MGFKETAKRIFDKAILSVVYSPVQEAADFCGCGILIMSQQLETLQSYDNRGIKSAISGPIMNVLLMD